MNNPLRIVYRFFMPYRWRVRILDALIEVKAVAGMLVAQTIFLIRNRKWFGVFQAPKTIFCWPDYPEKTRYVLCKIQFIAGYRITNSPNEYFHRMMEWEDVTTRQRSLQYLREIERLNCINARSLDINKEFTDKAFSEIFGYSLEVDPLRHSGQAVKKAKENALHDGKVIRCPIKTEAEEECVYQKVINNEFNDDYVYDIRVPVFGEEIPFLYYKYRQKNQRFDNFVKADVRSVDTVLTADEQAKIIRFTKRIGLEYGELDILRDKDDGRIYIVDANNTPSGPRCYQMTFPQYVFALTELTDAFDRVFMQKAEKPVSVPAKAKELFCRNRSTECTYEHLG